MELFAPKSVSFLWKHGFLFSTDGFYKLTGGQQLTQLEMQELIIFSLKILSSNLNGITSAVDPNNSIVVWSYRGSGATGTTNNKLLIYNYAVDK
ncbi:MAG: hypothetical protein CM15mV95_290 [Caudoviricetes sp.]|nr:MAG: hypothetical protein CM15mV95_290 [Caudoviricetes sp.]